MTCITTEKNCWVLIADFALLLLTSGMLHSHTGIVWRWVEWCGFEAKLRTKWRENDAKTGYFTEIWLRYGNQMLVEMEKLCWEAKIVVGVRLLCRWESVRGNCWRERVSLVTNCLSRVTALNLCITQEWVTGLRWFWWYFGGEFRAVVWADGDWIGGELWVTNKGNLVNLLLLWKAN